MTERTLSSLKVLDLSHFIAGPYCTKLLAGLGAEIIKAERPDGGDPSRRMGPFPDDSPDPEKSGLFLYLNTGKKGITLNLKSEGGKKLLKELVKDVDVLVESFAPRVMPSLGLDYETLAKINPKLVMTSISNFGQTGPYRDYKALEINLDALGGLMFMTGDPDREPLQETASTGQMTAGANACGATLMAVYGQRKNGTGQQVDISIMESVASLIDVKPLAWGRGRLLVRRNGNYCAAQTWPGGAGGDGVYRCKDGYIGVAISRADDTNLMVALTGMAEFADPDIGNMGFGKCVDDDKLNNLIEQGLKDRDKEELYRAAQELRLFWGSVRNIDEVVDNAHYKEREFWVDVDHPKAGTITYPRLPFVMNTTTPSNGRAPLLGEHNAEIYCDRLGYSKEDLVKMTGANII